MKKEYKIGIIIIFVVIICLCSISVLSYLSEQDKVYWDTDSGGSWINITDNGKEYVLDGEIYFRHSIEHPKLAYFLYDEVGNIIAERYEIGFNNTDDYAYGFVNSTLTKTSYDGDYKPYSVMIIAVDGHDNTKNTSTVHVFKEEELQFNYQ